MTIDMIVKKYNLKKKNKNKFGDIFEGHLSNEKIFALKPKEFMNLSGISIKKFLDFYKINMKNLLIIHDDIDLPLGKIKIKIGGGNAGHRGLKSIDSLIGKNYKRIRIGIDIGMAFQRFVDMVPQNQFRRFHMPYFRAKPSQSSFLAKRGISCQFERW